MGADGEYADLCLMDGVPEQERNAVARQVADAMVESLNLSRSPEPAHA